MEGFTMRTIRRMEWLGLAGITALAVVGSGACGSSSPSDGSGDDDASTSSSSGSHSSSGAGGSSGSSSGLASSSSSGSSGDDDSSLPLTDGGDDGGDGGDDSAATDGAATDSAPTEASTVDGGSDTGTPDASPADSGSDGTAPEAGPTDAGLDSGAHDAGPVDAGSVDAGSVTLRVVNYLGWCSVTVNGDAASTAFTITKSVPAGGTGTIVAKPASSAFEIGADPWFGVNQNDGGAAPGTDVGTGVNETSTVTVTTGANQCVAVCCQEPGNTPVACPTSNLCLL
jgi:hypothetical protein